MTFFIILPQFAQFGTSQMSRPACFFGNVFSRRVQIGAMMPNSPSSSGASKTWLLGLAASMVILLLFFLAVI